MGKSNKRKYKYSKPEFIGVICTRCGLCPEGTNPSFCYDEVYTDNPKRFIKSSFKNLIEIKRWLINAGHQLAKNCRDDDIEYLFQTSFCDSNYCNMMPELGEKCVYFSNCLLAFKAQLKNKTPKIVPIKHNKRGKTKKKQKTRYIPQPYPTFFCNKNMEQEVRTIVDGNNNKQ